MPPVSASLPAPPESVSPPAPPSMMSLPRMPCSAFAEIVAGDDVVAVAGDGVLDVRRGGDGQEGEPLRFAVEVAPAPRLTTRLPLMAAMFSQSLPPLPSVSAWRVPSRPSVVNTSLV